ncbi:hypothetical protein ACF09J_30155 [Streptomyces sp. NPDC014889]|uniref:hypothetical protein n=1 Tax=Streptomyces sp. NPDC014889 TaxID=3364928 RepID=UPI0036FF5803
MCVCTGRSFGCGPCGGDGRDLVWWSQHGVGVAFACATSGMQYHHFTGPRLYDVLSAAGPGFDPALRKDRQLDGDGPQLVLPRDRCGARYASGVRAIRVDGGYRAPARRDPNERL